MEINNTMYLTQLPPYVKSMILVDFSLHLKQCVHREGFNHSYAIKWTKMFFFYDEKDLVLSKVILNNISYQNKAVFQ